MSSLAIDNLFSFLLDYTLIVIFCLVGAVIKDTYNTLTGRETKVKIGRIFISTVVSSIILFSTSDIILSKLSWKLFILPCFIGGMLGFEIMEKIQKAEFWIKVITAHKNEIAKVLDDIKDKKEE